MFRVWGLFAVAERQVQDNAIAIAIVEEDTSTQTLTLLRAFVLQQVSLATTSPFYLTGGGNFESFFNRFPGFSCFWSSHFRI